jgi:hypothetical protein
METQPSTGSPARQELCRSAAADVSGFSLLYLGLLARLIEAEEGKSSFQELAHDALAGAEECAFAGRLLQLEAAKLSGAGDEPRLLLGVLRLIGESLTLLATAVDAEDAQLRPLAGSADLATALGRGPVADLLSRYGGSAT